MGYIMGESVKVPFTLAIALASSVGR